MVYGPPVVSPVVSPVTSPTNACATPQQGSKKRADAAAASSAAASSADAKAEELRQRIRESLGDEEYQKFAPDLANLDVESLEGLVDGMTGASPPKSPQDASGAVEAAGGQFAPPSRGNAVSKDGMPSSRSSRPRSNGSQKRPGSGRPPSGRPPSSGRGDVPPVDDLTGIRSAKAEELRGKIREQLGEEQYANHASELSEIGIDSLQELLDSLTATDGAGGGDSSPRDDLPPLQMPADLASVQPRELTLATLAKGTTQKAKKGESQDHLFARLTHLHLAEKKLTHLGPLVQQKCPMARVLYLSDNRLHTIGPLPLGLESLFLQDNDLWETGSWSQKLPNLKALNLSDNRLTRVDGLTKCAGLQELQLRRQRGSGLSIAPSALRVLAGTLRTLDISENRLTDLAPFAGLRCLQRLDAGANALTCVSAVAPMLQSCPALEYLRLEGNPMAASRSYRDDVVVLANRLQELDGKEINNRERIFVHEMSQRRRQRSQSRGSARRTSSEAGREPSGADRVDSRCPSGASNVSRRSASSSGRRADGGGGGLSQQPSKSKLPEEQGLPRLPPLLPGAGGGGGAGMMDPVGMGAKKAHRRQIDIC